MYRGKRKGFGQRFNPPTPSPYLQELYPYAGNFVRSPVSLSLTREDVKCFRSYAPECNDYAMRVALTRAKRAFSLDKPVPLLHLNDVRRKDLPIWSASPGLPWMQQGYRSKGEVRDDPDAWNKVRWFWHRVKDDKKVTPSDCCAFIRAHLVEKGGFKCRAVWGYPATMVFGEAVFALPLIEAYSRANTPIAYGYETGVAGMAKLKSMKGNHFLGLDYTCFDKTVPAWLIRRAFDILFFNLDFGNYQDYGIPRFDGIMRMWDFIVDYFINTPIRLCNGERYQKNSSIASGSYFTQLIGSVVNYIILEYISIKESNTIMSAKVLGDDSICGFERPIHPHTVQVHVATFGMSINVEKSGSSPYISDLSFLGYQINSGYPRKKREKVVAALIYPERPDRSWDDIASRALGILYANLGVDETIDYWCRRIVKFKPFDLALTRNQEKFIRTMKLNVTSELPDRLDFYRRLFCY